MSLLVLLQGGAGGSQVIEADGSGAGAGAASAIGIALWNTLAASSGAGTASGTGTALWNSSAAAAGAANADGGIGAAVWATVSAASGTSAVTGDASTPWAAVAAGAGLGDATGVSSATALVAVAYLLAAAHALTDPTNCGTASPALNLMPPPLHRDRALLEKVLTHAVAMSDPATRAELAAHIAAASTAFADAGGVTDRSLSVLRYNPHSLRTSCRSMGLGEVDICIAG